MSLPKGFKRLEYIQNTGTQFVDTGIVAKSSLIFRVKFDMQSSIGHNIAGCWVDSTHLYRFFTYNNQGYIDIGNGTSKRIIGGSIPYNTICEMEAGNLYIKNLQTGEIVASGDPVAEFTLTTNVCLGGTSREQESGKYYYLQIYDGAELVCDLVPCINDAGNVGMWDEVSKAFCPNAGTGAFTAGPVVPESVDESEITELEYIQSSGTQYIDSGFKPNQNTRVHFKFEMASYKSGMDCGVLGARTAYGNTAYSFWVTNTNQGFQDDYGSVANSISNTNTIGVHEVDKNKNVTTIDGVTYTNAASTFQTAYNMLIGVINTKGTADTNQVGTVKHFWYQVYDNGLLERDFVPAMLSDGELGLYDRVNSAFYRNAGTGEFIAGPEMVHEDYVELEYIESDGTNYMDTGVSAPAGFRIHCKAMLKEIAARLNMLFGSHDTASPYYRNFLAVTADGLWELGAYNPSDFGTASANVGYEITVSTISGDIECTVNGETLMRNGSIAVTAQRSDRTVYLFGLNYTDGTFPASMRLWSLSLYLDASETNLQRAYIPKLHSSGVAGLWDSVNERFYASATTTDFIAGPEAQAVPKAPSSFRVEASTDTQVTLTWDPMEKVLGYRLYRSGQLLADTEETSVSVAVEPFAGAVFTVTAYNENGEGAASTLTYYSVPEDPILFLITDRTQQDVTERNPKGYYAASDLNRVGYAVEYLAGRLKKSGVTVAVSPLLTWTDADWGTPTAMIAYLADVKIMRGALKLAESTPTVSADMEKLTYTEANQIEMILLALDAHIKEMLLVVDAGWAMDLAYTGLYAKEAYR